MKNVNCTLAEQEKVKNFFNFLDYESGDEVISCEIMNAGKISPQGKSLEMISVEYTFKGKHQRTEIPAKLGGAKAFYD